MSKASIAVEFCPSGEKLLPKWRVVIPVDHHLVELAIESDKSISGDALTI